MTATPTATPIPPTAAAGRPLTPEQRALWAHARLHPGDPAYNGVFAYRITGDVDAERLRAAVETVVRASAGFNTVIVEGPDGPRALVPPDVAYRVRLTPARSEAEVREHLSRVAGEPMGTDRWPLYELRVWTVPGAVLLTAVIAHVVGDAHALWGLLDHVALAYTDPAAQRTRADELAAVPEPVAPDPHEHAAAVAFFAEHLAGLDALDCGLAARRDARGQLAGVTDVLELGADRTAAVHAFARANAVTPFAVLLTAFVITLSALSGRERVVVGVPVANRRSARERRTVGLAVTTLPLAVTPAEHATVADLARHLGVTTLRLLRHRGLDLHAHAAAVFGGHRPARFDVDAVFTHYPRPLAPELPGAAVQRLDVPTHHVKYPLGVTAEQTPGGLVLSAEHTHDLVSAWPLRVLRTVLDGLLADAGASPTAVPLLDDVHRRTVDQLVNATVPVPDVPRSLWDGFVVSAERRGDAVAVQDDSGTTTYAELLEQARAYARGLAARVPGPHVGVSLHRSRRLVAVLLGVLGAAKAIVPIDPNSPVERARHVIDQFDALPVVVDPDALRGVEHVERLDPDDLAATGGPEPAGPVPDDLAYIFFTSGSTGRPKGVQIGHRNLARFVRISGLDLELRSDDTWCQFHSYAFDVSVFEIYGSLLHGGRLVVPSWLTTRTPADLRDLIVRTGVTVLSQTPSAFVPLLATIRPEDVPRLAVRRVTVGGEAVRFAALRRWFALTGRRTRVFNIYGPTECSVWATCHEITAHDADAEEDSVIGWPLRDLRAHVVDAALRPLPVGAPGELLIEGPAVSRGYFGRPDLSAERFVRAPDSDATVYRTGDVVRLRPDGRLVYLDRRDSQVQIRGHRVELGEVAAAVVASPGVADAVVVPRGEGRLVAYLVEAAPVTDAQLREHLRRHLPPYMMPAALVRLPALPLTTNGKVDRAALPDLPDLPAVPSAAQEPLTPAQERVRAVWAGVLGAGLSSAVGIGPDDAFFDVGGSSLDVVEVHRRLVSAFGADDLDPTELFEFTTVRALAERLTGPRTAAAAPVPVRRTRRSAS